MAKKYTSTSRADRTEDKRKRQSNKAEEKRNSRKRDVAIAAAGGAGALATAAARNKLNLYRGNLRASVNAVMKERPYLDKKEVTRDYRKTSARLAMGNRVVTGRNAEPRPFQPKNESLETKSQKRTPPKPKAKPRGGRRLGGVPGQGMGGRGQGGRGGGGFLARGK